MINQASTAVLIDHHGDSHICTGLIYHATLATGNLPLTLSSPCVNRSPVLFANFYAHPTIAIRLASSAVSRTALLANASSPLRIFTV
jgi:hypothetical protein